MAYIGPEPNPGQNREVDDISSGFNGSEVNFTLQVNSQNVSPGSSNNIIVSLGGVVQNPSTDYTIAASTITFTTAPASGLSFFGLVLGQQIDTQSLADGASPTMSAPSITGDLSIADKIVHTGDTNTAIRFPAADTITAETGGNERLRVASSGNLGIGTTSPSYKLEVSAETGISGDVRFLTGARHKFIGGGSGNNLELGTYSSSNTSRNIAMVMDSSGNTHFGGTGTLNDSNVVSVIPADGRISFGMDGRSSFVTGESGAYIYSGDGASGTTVAGDLILQSRSNQNRTIRFVTGSTPTQRMSIDSGGLKFGTDTADANALDDYEEGTFTPTVTTSSGSIAVNGSYNVLSYTKIGRLVHVTGQIVLTPTNPSGNLDINGLPFTPVDLSDLAGRSFCTGLGYFNGSNVPSGSAVYTINMRVLESSTTFRVEGIAPNYDESIADWVGNGTDIWVNLTYFAA